MVTKIKTGREISEIPVPPTPASPVIQEWFSLEGYLFMKWLGGKLF